MSNIAIFALFFGAVAAIIYVLARKTQDAKEFRTVRKYVVDGKVRYVDAK